MKHLAQYTYAEFSSFLAEIPVTDGEPAAPTTGLGTFGTNFIGWMKWIVLIAGIIGLIICAGMLVVGRRNRNAVAQDGIVGGVWVIGGICMAAVAFSFVDAIWNLV